MSFNFIDNMYAMQYVFMRYIFVNYMNSSQYLKIDVCFGG